MILLCKLFKIGVAKASQTTCKYLGSLGRCSPRKLWCSKITSEATIWYKMLYVCDSRQQQQKKKISIVLYIYILWGSNCKLHLALTHCTWQYSKLLCMFSQFSCMTQNHGCYNCCTSVVKEKKMPLLVLSWPSMCARSLCSKFSFLHRVCHDQNASLNW